MNSVAILIHFRMKKKAQLKNNDSIIVPHYRPFARFSQTLTQPDMTAMAKMTIMQCRDVNIVFHRHHTVRLQTFERIISNSEHFNFTRYL